MDSNQAVRKDKTKNIFRFMVGSQFSVSLFSIIMSLAVLALMSAIYGANPWDVLNALFQGALSGKRAFVSTVTEMAPLILTGLAVYIPLKAGFFNVGGQGQLQVGALAAVFVTTNFIGNPVLGILLGLLAAMIAGSLGVVIPLLLKIKRGANEVTTTIMMNFACTNFVYAMISTAMKDPKSFYGATQPVPDAFKLPSLPASSEIHIGVWIAILISLGVAWYMRNSVGGLELKAVGLNTEAAKTAGINVKRILIGATITGAAFAGLAGGMEVMGVTSRVAEGWALDWGFTGLSVAFLGTNPVGIIPVAFILAVIETGARYMQAMTDVPSALISIMKGIPIILFLAFNAYAKLKRMKQKS